MWYLVKEIKQVHTSVSTPQAQPCITLIGMAASGKSTIGRALAQYLAWAHVDADAVIEAYYGVALQTLAESMDKESFLDCEASVIKSLRLQRTVLSAGGSVVYRPEAMLHLQVLGPIVRLDVPLPVILERIARKPNRGLAIAPGQSIEGLVNERELLYAQWADLTFATADLAIEESARSIAKLLNIE